MKVNKQIRVFFSEDINDWDEFMMDSESDVIKEINSRYPSYYTYKTINIYKSV